MNIYKLVVLAMGPWCAACGGCARMSGTTRHIGDISYEYEVMDTASEYLVIDKSVGNITAVNARTLPDDVVEISWPRNSSPMHLVAAYGRIYGGIVPLDEKSNGLLVVRAEGRGTACTQYALEIYLPDDDAGRPRLLLRTLVSAWCYFSTLHSDEDSILQQKLLIRRAELELDKQRLCITVNKSEALIDIRNGHSKLLFDDSDNLIACSNVLMRFEYDKKSRSFVIIN